MIKTLASHIRDYKKYAILAPVLVSCEVLLEVLIPYISSQIIDQGISQGNMQAVAFHGTIMLLCALLSLAFGVGAGYMSAKASAGFAKNLREAVFDQVQNFSFSNIDKFSPSSLITRMTTDITNVQNAFQMIIRVAVRSPFMLICSMIMTFLISPQLSSIFLIAVICLAIILSLIIWKVTPIFQNVFNAYDNLNERTQQNVSAIRVVKSFNREKYEIGLFDKAVFKLYKLSVKAENLVVLNVPILFTTVFATMLTISWFGAQFIVIGNMTTGELTSMFSYTMSIMMALMFLSFILVMVSMSVASAKRITQVLGERPYIKNPDNPITEIKNGDIDFNNVSFAYLLSMGILTLKHINLHIKSGQTIGVIGTTGSGKTSLVNLVSRLYDANAGSVRVGGIDVRKYDVETLRNACSVVLQKNMLFSGTILENLRWGNLEATEQECIEACKLACADEFIEKMPDGYNTYIEQGGSNVSGGQRQRLCIARALLKKPKVLILDDSTSAVDTATEAKIRKSFNKTIPGTTKIIISQRISSIENADKIIVMDNGEIDAFDTHENLIKTNKIYKGIYEIQSRTSGDFDEQ